ncbi:MAG: glycosyltransferase [Candidatus Eisenbacteria bacterium]|nr:glycosyltransferase [Candidatus Eisenbacteria bacterium]
MNEERVYVVLPARNEAARVGEVIGGVRRVLPGGRIVVVDDASRDATSTAAAEAGADLLRHPFHLGYGGALQTGYRYAARNGAQAVVQLDADGQHDPASIPDLLQALRADGLDLVLGSRFRAGRASYELSPLRRLGMSALRAMTKRLLRQPITDPTSGYQALSGRLARFYADWDGFPADAPDADVLVWVARSGYRIGEVPVRMHARSGGRSMHAGWEPLGYAFKMTLALAVSASRPARDRTQGD